MPILPVSLSKTLKLTNPLIYEISDSNLQDLQNIEQIIVQMENYIRSKGALPLGPVVQCTIVEANGNDEPKIRMQFIRQSNQYINHVEAPYTMEAILRCPNCLFVRFHDDEGKLQNAYNKLTVVAYEEGIELTGKSYTVFTAKSADDFSADVFMEKK